MMKKNSILRIDCLIFSNFYSLFSSTPASKQNTLFQIKSSSHSIFCFHKLFIYSFFVIKLKIVFYLNVNGEWWMNKRDWYRIINVNWFLKSLEWISIETWIFFIFGLKNNTISLFNIVEWIYGIAFEALKKFKKWPCGEWNRNNNKKWLWKFFQVIF